jgi:hypothetical protein
VFVYDTNYVDLGLVQTQTGRLDDDPGFRIWPNPAGDNLNLQSLQHGMTEIGVYSLSGSLVLQRKMSLSGGIVTLDISAFKPGIYIIRVTGASEVHEARFVKK